MSAATRAKTEAVLFSGADKGKIRQKPDAQAETGNGEKLLLIIGAVQGVSGRARAGNDKAGQSC
jgi:hypothetical protein